MPELPEVETIRNGLNKFIFNRNLLQCEIHVKKLRYLINFTCHDLVLNSKVCAVDRRSKYILVHLSSGQTFMIHLGMSGTLRVEQTREFTPRRHDHVQFIFENNLVLVYNDPRRFGFIELIATKDVPLSPHFKHLGPEPLSNQFNPHVLYEKLATSSRTLKNLLMDQRLVAGLGNIYVCEALFRAGMSPLHKGKDVTEQQATQLTRAIVGVLREAIAKGGSTLRDYNTAEGKMGYFQHSFAVYNRAGQPCIKPTCSAIIIKQNISGRSTYSCPACQNSAIGAL